MTAQRDVFSEARERFTVYDLWPALGLPGHPASNCRSPFRDDKKPSFSIYDGNRKWHDHSTGEGGDVIDFVCRALGCNHAEVREWFAERLGIDYPPIAAPRPRVMPTAAKEIAWPAELVTGNEQTWRAFAAKRRVPYPTIKALVELGFLRFLKVDGVRCFTLTGPSRRVAEIRRIDGGSFASGRKAFPLRGVDKSFPLGHELLTEGGRGKPILLCEGSTDWLAGLGAYTTYLRRGGTPWITLAMLGASCRRLAPEVERHLVGRLVRIVPDADEAGDAMANHWRDILLKRGCIAEIVNLPRGRDLRDMIERGELKPEELFSTSNED